MTLKEAVAIISRNAKLYQTELCKNQLFFLYRDGNNNVDYIEAVFRTNNYMHLTGIDTKSHMRAGGVL